MNHAQVKERLDEVLNAWTTLRPEKSFAGLTVAQFKQIVQPSYDTRASIASLEAQMTSEYNKRNDADEKAMLVLNRIVSGVKADPEEGDNSDLYKAMGYTRRSERSSGLHRSKVAESDAGPTPAS